MATRCVDVSDQRVDVLTIERLSPKSLHARVHGVVWHLAVFALLPQEGKHCQMPCHSCGFLFMGAFEMLIGLEAAD
jgi:hypothetical protein